MEKQELRIETRERVGKGISRQLRRKGLVPGVVYGRGMTAVPVIVNPKELFTALETGSGLNTILTLQGVTELSGQPVIVSELQYEPLRGGLRHVDLHKINMTEKVRVKVPVSLKGTAIGVKNGGILEFMLHAIEIECLPTQIPAHFDLEISGLNIGAAVHAEDIILAPGLKLLEEPKAVVVGVVGKAKEEEAAPAE